MTHATKKPPLFADKPVEKIKTLDDHAMELCRLYFGKGFLQKDIIKALKDAGYRNSRGGELLSGDVSNFMISAGLRYYATRKSRKAARPKLVQVEDKTPKAKTPKATGILYKVTEVVNSNLSPDLKEQVLRSLVG